MALVKLMVAFFREAFEMHLQARTRQRELDDRIIVWLVGISAGSIALLVGSLPETGVVAPGIKWGAGLFVLSIVFGIVHRCVSRELALITGREIDLGVLMLKGHEIADSLKEQGIDEDEIKPALEGLVAGLEDGRKKRKKPSARVKKVLGWSSDVSYYGSVSSFVVGGGVLVSALILGR